jgi:hypothetical protein
MTRGRIYNKNPPLVMATDELQRQKIQLLRRNASDTPYFGDEGTSTRMFSKCVVLYASYCFR